MDQTGSSQLLPSSSTTDNPVLAVGRKVKEILSSNQPSVRILREPLSAGHPRQVPVSPSTPKAPTGRFTAFENRVRATIKPLFGGDGNSRNDINRTHSDHEYDRDTVDLLDVVDPEVATLSTLTNVQNSLFVPSVGRFIDRRPAYRLSPQYGEISTIDKLKASLKRISSPVGEGDEKGSESRLLRQQERLSFARTDSIPSTVNDSRYAVLPPGVTLRGWKHEHKEELDDRVRHMLHSRRARFKRSMKGFWQYVHRPLGLFVTVYATLITLFGAAWVLFLIGWISLGSKRDYIINIVDNVLVALFAIIGDGLAPFRAVDTYHMIYIAYYYRKTHKRRKQLGLPKLVDRNDLPDQRKEDVEPSEVDIESLVALKIPHGLARIVAPRIPKRLARRIITHNKGDNPSYEYSVLTEEEQAKLEFHERKFSKSHTFYKPHETETHYAFPLKLLVAVVLLLDCHSALQITLGACTWGIPYKTRPFALTTVILCCSITCNIMGGVLISVGDKRTRKKHVIERMMRQELTAEAIQHMEAGWLKEAEERGEIDKGVRKKFEDKKEEAENQEIKQAWKVVPSLPKTLLGKGVDHRQPSLPQKARRSTAHIDSAASGSSTPRNAKSKTNIALPQVQESSALPPLPKPVMTRGAVARREDPREERKGQKFLRLIRRADMDRS